MSKPRAFMRQPHVPSRAKTQSMAAGVQYPSLKKNERFALLPILDEHTNDTSGVQIYEEPPPPPDYSRSEDSPPYYLSVDVEPIQDTLTQEDFILLCQKSPQKWFDAVANTAFRASA
ncbi:hypothetical protein P152DRAFT_497491 [Eremomyces bilateralis CBS 781.70]|uniref:Uncharacterized protein n=1 Tax=Eremomyces bilateralis CBS 781.70 TaxID=1392243 RepID=A0A6G1FS25_9PEZI|nr:uncharacterized protein P152DRAFT_497491 [Eremomyces bilateralis CBS 781.70]KAF1808520.1 hypothetical protein P152DRAFT_497491 [Eremomyces bilateralis CBS 781.70]